MVINGQQAVKMPYANSKLKFEYYHKQLVVPFVFYVDFEAMTEKVQGCQLHNEDSFTEAYRLWIRYKLVCCYDDKFSKPI